jgi:hypothetical protein
MSDWKRDLDALNERLFVMRLIPVIKGAQRQQTANEK